LDILSVVATLVTSIIFLGLASLAVYWALVRGFKPRTAILMGAMMIMVYVGGSFAADQIGSNPNSLKSIEEVFNQNMQAKIKSLADEKVPQEEIDQLQVNLKKYLLYCFPAWIISGAFFLGFLAYYLVSSTGSRITSRIAQPTSLSEWVVPEPMIFGLILGGVIKLSAPENTWMEIVGNNILVLFVVIYSFAGVPIISFYFKKWRFPMIARFLSYLLLFSLALNFELIELMFGNVFFILGVMDIWLDFRKLKKPPMELTA